MVALAGTVAMSELPKVLNVAARPLNVTPVAPVKLAPLIVTLLPTCPLVGEKPVIVGAGVVTTVKTAELATLPDGVVTATGPVVAPTGTVAIIAPPNT